MAVPFDKDILDGCLIHHTATSPDLLAKNLYNVCFGGNPMVSEEAIARICQEGAGRLDVIRERIIAFATNPPPPPPSQQQQQQQQQRPPVPKIHSELAEMRPATVFADDFFGADRSPKFDMGNFPAKFELFRQKMMKIGLDKFDFKHPSVIIKVVRDPPEFRSLVRSSMEEFANHRDMEKFKKGFHIRFEGEEGLDWGALRREWFLIFSEWLFRPSYGLFTKVNDVKQEYIPSHFSYFQDAHLMQFEAFGRIFGLALFTGSFVNAHFTRPFYKLILGQKLVFSDMKDVDEDVYRNCSELLKPDCNAEDLCMTFSDTLAFADSASNFDLVPDGSNRAVDNANARDYLALLAQWKMFHVARDQIEHFIKGVYEVIPLSVFQELKLSPEDLDYLACGSDTVDVADWEKYMNVPPDHGFKKTDNEIKWFVLILRNVDSETLKKILFYATGSYRVPLRGFRDLHPPFTIFKGDIPNNGLCKSSACFNRMYFPNYSSYEKMKEMVMKSLEYGGAGGFESL